MYGDKELTDRPVEFAQLHEGSYDHHLLPFMPKHHGSMQSTYVELQETNKQWRPVAHSLKELWDELEQLHLDSKKIAAQMNLPLLKYAFHLLPWIQVELMGSPPFEFQLQPWFNPKALHA